MWPSNIVNACTHWMHFLILIWFDGNDMQPSSSVNACIFHICTSEVSTYVSLMFFFLILF